VILALRLFREVKRLNKQEEATILQPCKTCGEYPYERFSPERNYGTKYPFYHYRCKCHYYGEEGIYFKQEKAIKYWNENYGTLDELELKMIREGITV